MRVVVGFSPGGGFDRFARLVARHLPQYIPGNPSIIVQNRPGAGSLIAANLVYAQQPADGLTIVEFIYSIVMQPFLGDPAAQFDATEFQYLGDPSGGGVNVVWIRSDHPFQTMEQWKNSSEPLVFGGSGPGTSLNTLPRTIETMGFPTKVVLGYGGTAPITLAIQSGEVDAMVLTLSTMKAQYGSLISEGLIRPLAKLTQGSGTNDVDVPLLDEFVTSDEQQQLLDLHKALGADVFTFAVPPGVPEERVELLRQAFIAMAADPAFGEEIVRLGNVLNFVSGEEIQSAVAVLGTTSPDVLDTYKLFLTGD